MNWAVTGIPDIITKLSPAKIPCHDKQKFCLLKADLLWMWDLYCLPLNEKGRGEIRAKLLDRHTHKNIPGKIKYYMLRDKKVQCFLYNRTTSPIQETATAKHSWCTLRIYWQSLCWYPPPQSNSSSCLCPCFRHGLHPSQFWSPSKLTHIPTQMHQRGSLNWSNLPAPMPGHGISTSPVIWEHIAQGSRCGGTELKIPKLSLCWNFPHAALGFLPARALLVWLRASQIERN